MKKVIVTGATGFLGQSLVNELLKNEGFIFIVIGGRSECKINQLPHNPRLKFVMLDDLFTRGFTDVDTVINCAFPRSNDSTVLAQALDFTAKLTIRLEELKVKSVINISTQGVYKRLPVGELSNEDSPISPIDLYSMSKYSTEKMFHLSDIPYVTNVRLASLMMPQRFLYFFVQKAINGERFTVTAPNQYAALLDVNDAATGLTNIAGMSPERRAKVYNLGIGTQYSLQEYAESVKTIGDALGYNVRFDIVDNGTSICAGMDCSRLKEETGWTPSVMKNEMIKKLFLNH